MTVALLIALLVPQASADRFAFDDRSGTIGFDTTSSLHGIPGQANSFSGEVNVDGENPITGDLTIQTQAITTGLGLRDKRLWGYVLDTKKYPTMTIKVGDVTGDKAGFTSGEGKGEIVLEGQMMMRTTEREVSIPCTYEWDGDTVKLAGKYEFLWTDFQLPDPSIPLARMYPEVAVSFDVAAKKRP